MALQLHGLEVLSHPQTCPERRKRPDNVLVADSTCHMFDKDQGDSDAIGGGGGAAVLEAAAHVITPQVQKVTVEWHSTPEPM